MIDGGLDTDDDDDDDDERAKSVRLEAMTIALVMDTASVVTGLMRLCLVAAVAYMNCRALLQVCFRSSLCIHNLVSTAVVLANILYLVTWPPFLLYALSAASSSSSLSTVTWSGGTGWSPVNEQIFCLSQNYVVNAMGMVLLSLLVVRLADRLRETVLRWPPLGRTRNVLFAFIMWILPQFTYDLVSLATNANSCAAADRLRRRHDHNRPVFHFLGEMVHIVSTHDVDIYIDNGHAVSESTDRTLTTTTTTMTAASYSVGFLVCEQELTDTVVAFHLWQYLVLVIPYAVAAAIFGSAITMSVRRPRLRRQSLTASDSCDRFEYLSASDRLLLEDHEMSKTAISEDVKHSTDSAGRCGHRCQSRMTVIDLILYSNIVWHLVGRPLVILHAVYWPTTSDGPNVRPTFLDVGSHLMMAFSCCLAPTICGLAWTSASSSATSSNSGASVCVLRTRIASRKRRSMQRSTDGTAKHTSSKSDLIGDVDDVFIQNAI